MSTNEINRDLGLLVRDKTREILKLRKEVKELEKRIQRVRDCAIATDSRAVLYALSDDEDYMKEQSK